MKPKVRLYWLIMTFTIIMGFDITKSIIRAQDIKVNVIAWRPDGLVLAAGSDTGVVLFDEAMSPIQQLSSSSQRVETLAWSPDGRSLAATIVPEKFDFGSFPQGKLLLVWDYSPSNDMYSLSRTISYDLPSIVSLTDMAWSPTEPKLAIVEGRWEGVGSQVVDDFISMWDTNSWERTSFESSHIYSGIKHLIWSPNGQFLAGYGVETCSGFRSTCPDDIRGDGGTFIIDPETGERISFANGGDGETDIEWLGDTKLVGLTGSMVFYDVLLDGTLTNEQIFRDETHSQHYNYYQVERLNNGNLLVLYNDSTLNLVNPHTLQTQLLTYIPDMYQMELNPNQTILAIKSRRMTLSMEVISEPTAWRCNSPRSDHPPIVLDDLTPVITSTPLK